MLCPCILQLNELQSVLLVLAGLCVGSVAAELTVRRGLRRVKMNVTSNNAGLMEINLDSAVSEHSICPEVLMLFPRVPGS